MALSFIGKPISLISHSDVRYRGILAGIDPQASTIQLSNVYSMGTESRRPANQFIAPVQDPYAYIIFRASEVKDLSVDEPAPPQHNVHDDPAVLGAGGPAPKAYPPYPAAQQQQPINGAPSTQPSQPAYTAPPAPAAPAQQQTQAQPVAPSQPAQPPVNRAPQQSANNRRPNPVHTAAASLETVERALGDLRVSHTGAAPTHSNGPRGGRRGGHQGGRGGHRANEVELKVPKTDFDFASANAKFDKAAISPAGTKTTTEDENTSGDAGEGEKAAEDVQQPAYNPQKSFFDSLSSSSATPASGSGGANQGNNHRGGRRGGGVGRNRREEEREKNVATFGEPGGVGLLGPGGYVGGWGGYGRRGGRPRRGGPGRGQGGGGNASAPQVQARG